MAYQSLWIARRDEILSIATQVRAQHPDAWEAIKVHGTEDRRFINLVSAACIAKGIPAGVNLKRGGPKQSIDVIALPNASGCGDSTGTHPGLELIDLVGGAEGPTPSLGWGDVTQATLDGGGRGGWVAGSASGTPTPVPVPAPTLALKPREQFAGEFTRVNDFYGSPDGLRRVGGMVAGVDASVFNVLRGVADGSITDMTAIQNAARDVLKLQCDKDSMIAWGYDLMAGARVDDVLTQIRNSHEWKDKHK